MLLFVVTMVAACSSNKKVAETEETKIESVQAAFSDKVYFALNKADLNATSKKALDNQVSFMKANPQAKVTVTGNCDERGTKEYNQKLGQKRAYAVKNYLVSNGIRAGRITTLSNGKDKPLAKGTGEAVWSKNRNAITTLNK